MDYKNIKNIKDVKYNKFICDFYNELKKFNNEYSKFIFLCIGTDRMTGDCFGPLVGSKIKKGISNNNNCIIYGDLTEPLIYYNIGEKIKEINENYKNSCVIAIDAALSSEKNIGKIFVKTGGLKTGRAINKFNKEIGHISIKAIIGENHKKLDKNMQLLQNTSLNFVMELVDIVSMGIIEILNNSEINNLSYLKIN